MQTSRPLSARSLTPQGRRAGTRTSEGVDLLLNHRVVRELPSTKLYAGGATPFQQMPGGVALAPNSSSAAPALTSPGRAVRALSLEPGGGCGRRRRSRAALSASPSWYLRIAKMGWSHRWWPSGGWPGLPQARPRSCQARPRRRWCQWPAGAVPLQVA